MINPNNAPQGAQIDELSSGNAILVDSKILAGVRAWLTQHCTPLDQPCSDREIIDTIVNQVGELLAHKPFYYCGQVDSSKAYKWFGSDMSRKVSSMNNLRDKGRWVDACLILYQYGQAGLDKWCGQSRKRYPPELTVDRRTRLQTSMAAMPDPEAGRFEVEPTSCPVEGTQ